MTTRASSTCSKWPSRHSVKDRGDRERPNFGFAHSAGDALAAIIHDPASQAPDRFTTFPWVAAMNAIGRRHDRDPNAGWAWFGSNWNSGYGGEQVLSTTLFRLYNSLGGGATSHVPTQSWGSRYTSFLIIKAIGTLAATTPTQRYSPPP